MLDTYCINKRLLISLLLSQSVHNMSMKRYNFHSNQPHVDYIDYKSHIMPVEYI